MQKTTYVCDICRNCVDAINYREINYPTLSKQSRYADTDDYVVVYEQVGLCNDCLQKSCRIKSTYISDNEMEFELLDI